MRFIRYAIWIMYPIVLIALFASLLTTRTYMDISKDRYESHERIEFDHEYVSHKLIDYLNYRHNNLEFGAHEDDEDTLLRHEIVIVNGEERLISEIEHMKDVRAVYTQIRIAGILSLLGVVTLSAYMYKKSPSTLYRTFRDIYILPLLFVLFVGSWFVIDFDYAFTIFHEIFFDANWTFSYNDALIQLLPPTFWMVSGIIILFLLTVAIFVTSFVTRKFFKERLLENEKEV